MSAVFLDLDGTLTDSRPGIVGALTAALNEVGRPDLAASDLTWMIGPEITGSFRKAGVADIPAAVEAYRRNYTTHGLFDNSVYDGILGALDALKAMERRLYVATAKPHVQARRITAHFGLAPYFAAEFGPEMDGTRGHKADLLAYALNETGETAGASVMVGDRSHDIEAARAVGMPVIAVTWGYGTPAEHAEADAICERPADLPEMIARFAA